MTTHVYWMLELAIQPERLEAWKTLMREMVDSTEQDEPDALNYEWTISEDGKTCHLYERYRDSAAVMTHLGTFGKKFARRFLELSKPTRCTVYGSPSEQVRAGLAALRPVYMAPLGGFDRQGGSDS